jgi:hypothetical protein
MNFPATSLKNFFSAGCIPYSVCLLFEYNMNEEIFDISTTSMFAEVINTYTAKDKSYKLGIYIIGILK